MLVIILLFWIILNVELHFKLTLRNALDYGKNNF
jgi:hypothetical protein